MNSLEATEIVAPNGKTDDCAKFTIEDANVIFTFQDICMVGQDYVFGCYVKSDDTNSIAIGDTSYPASPAWNRVVNKFNAKSVDFAIKFVTPGTYYLYNSKLEIGTVDTDWTPAPEDIFEKSASIEVTLDGITQTVTDLEGNVSKVEQTAESLTQTITDVEGNVSQLQQTVDGVQQTVGDLEGNYSSLQQTVNGISSTVSDVEGNVSSLTQTVDGISSTVGDLEGNYSQLTQTVNGFEVSINNANSTANSALSTAQQNGQILIDKTQQYVTSPVGYLLATANKTINDTGNSGYIHVWGWIGGWGANNGGQIDVMIPLRGTTASGIVISQLDDHAAASTMESGEGASLRVRNVNNKATLYAAGTGYFSIRLFCEGKDFTINNATNANWDTGTAIWQSHGARSQDSKTATNYLRFDSTGLCVGNYAGTLQGNVKIDSDGIDIYCGNTLLAWMNANTIALGENSTASYIRFSAGAGSIGCGSGGETYLQANGRDLSVIGNNLHARGDLRTTIGNSTSVASVAINSGNIYMSKVGNGQQTYTPIYRLNNPYASNTKMWTASSSERNSLINAGWTSEGTGWYAFA